MQSPFCEGKISKSGKNILNLFKIFCPLNCANIITYGEIENHISYLCEKIPKILTCDLCLKKFYKQEEENECLNNHEILKHNDECPFLIVECCFCGNSCQKSHFPKHVLECSENYKECNECHVYYNFKYKESHNEKFCEILKGIISIVEK